MLKTRPHRLSRLSRLCLPALAVLFIPAARGQEDSDNNASPGWLQHLRIGAPVMVNVRAHFSVNGTFNLMSQAGATGVDFVNHIYDDGYVKVDNTGNSGIPPETGYWGYDNASQYNAGANTLTMHSTTSYSAEGDADKEAQPFVGFEAAYGTDIFHWGPTHLGWELGAGLMPMHITDAQPLSANVNQSVYTFSTAGIVVPTAPYSGGPSGQAEPTISDVATAAGTTTGPGTVIGTHRLELMLYTVRLGPTFSWDLCRYASLEAGGGPVFGVLTGDYKYDETVITSTGGGVLNSGSIGTTKTVFGAYASAGILVHVVDQGDIYLNAKFMPLGNVNIDTPGRDARLDLRQAMQFTAGVNWSF
jgi:hypothetical protein